MKILPLAAAFSLLPLGAEAAPADPAAPIAVRWTIQPVDRDPARVQLTLTRAHGGGHWMHRNSIELAELRGLDAAQLESREGTQVRFRLAREAGAFDCEGLVRSRQGGGDCRFEADERFVGELARRGIGRPSSEQLFRMSLAGVGLVYLDELDRQGYAPPALDQLVDAAHHGAGLDYLRAMGRLGYRAGTLAGLVRMRDHGVTPDHVAELAALGYADLAAEEIVRLRTHGVTASFIRRAAGGGRLSAEELVRLRTGG